MLSKFTLNQFYHIECLYIIIILCVLIVVQFFLKR